MFGGSWNSQNVWLETCCKISNAHYCSLVTQFTMPMYALCTLGRLNSADIKKNCESFLFEVSFRFSTPVPNGLCPAHSSHILPHTVKCQFKIPLDEHVSGKNNFQWMEWEWKKILPSLFFESPQPTSTANQHSRLAGNSKGQCGKWFFFFPSFYL